MTQQEKFDIVIKLLQSNEEDVWSVVASLVNHDWVENDLTEEQRAEVEERRRNHLAGESKSYTLEELDFYMSNESKIWVTA